MMMLSGDPSSARLERLARRVHELDAVFSCGGTVTLDEPVQLRFRGGKRVPIEPNRWGRWDDLGKRLMKACPPAPFGVGTKTRTDARVRKGGQLLAADGALEVDGLDLLGWGILERVREVLCPDSAAPPIAELHALNVYRSGGHFVRHKDTPRGRDCLGTLVVCLPLSFRGGRLVLRHGTLVGYDWETYDFGFARREQPHRIRWAAFYGDVDHAIEPVRSGTRVTLTWLLRQPAEKRPSSREPASTEIDLEHDLVEALADPRFMAGGGTLGVPCLHLYGEESGQTPPGHALSRADAARLKGRDGLVALAALRAGLQVQYRPYLYETSANDSWRLSRPPTARETAIFEARRLGLSKLVKTMPIEREIDAFSEDDVTWLAKPPWSGRWCGGGDDVVPVPDPAADLLGELDYSATDYFGNEGGHCAFYTAAAMLIRVPPANDRRQADAVVIDDAAPAGDGRTAARHTAGSSADPLERLAGTMTVAELCERSGVELEALMAFCFGDFDAKGLVGRRSGPFEKP